MKTLIKKLSILIITTIVLGIAAKLLITSNKRSNDELVVGMMSGWAPFMTINAAGEYEGFDIDVAKQLAKRMGKKLVIKDLGALASLFVALDQGKIDMIFSGLDITQDRLAQMNMIQYTGQNVNEYLLVFWDKIPAGISTLQDLKKLNKPCVCVEPGNSPEKVIDQCDFIEKKSMASLADMLLDIKYGKSLAMFVEPQVAAQLKQKNSQITWLSVPLPPAFQIYGMGIAIKKNNAQLTAAVTRSVQEMKRDGTLQALERRWQLYTGAQ